VSSQCRNKRESTDDSYNWRPQIPSGNGSTGAHILVALSAAFGSIAFFTLLHSATNLNSGGASFFLVVSFFIAPRPARIQADFQLFTNLLAFISFLIVVITWATAKRRFNNDDGPNTFFDAHYGPAFALVIVGWLLYLAAIPLVFVGWFRNRGYRNDAPVTTTTTTTTRRKRWF
jgi:hypothetical protein